MKLTKEQLKSIIKEELGKIINEIRGLGYARDAAQQGLPDEGPFDSRVSPSTIKLKDDGSLEKPFVVKYNPSAFGPSRAEITSCADAAAADIDVKSKMDYNMMLAVRARCKQKFGREQGPETSGRHEYMQETKEDIQRMVEEELAAVTKGN